MLFRSGLATSWKNTSPTTWEFTLRQGTQFQNGEPFTADAIVKLLEWFKTDEAKPRTPSAVGQRLLDARCMLLLLPPRGTHASGDGLRGPVKNAMGPSLFYRNYAFGPPRGL